MSPRKTIAPVGERLPYLLAKLKTPRVLERLEQTAATAREEGWPYEQFLEVLLEAEVFARDASGARNRIRHAAFPAHKTLEDFDFSAQPAAEKPASRPAGLDPGAHERLLLRAARHRQDALGHRVGDQGLPSRAPRRVSDRAAMDRSARAGPAPQRPRRRAAAPGAPHPPRPRRARPPPTRPPPRHPAPRPA